MKHLFELDERVPKRLIKSLVNAFGGEDAILTERKRVEDEFKAETERRIMKAKADCAERRRKRNATLADAGAV